MVEGSGNKSSYSQKCLASKRDKECMQMALVERAMEFFKIFIEHIMQAWHYAYSCRYRHQR